MILSTIACILEDSLIQNFDYDRRTSFAHIEHGRFSLECFYDELSRSVSVDLFGNKSGMELINVQDSISNAIDKDKIENEVMIRELEDERESEYEWDMRDALDHSPLYR